MWINRVTERNNYKILKLMKIYIKMKIEFSKNKTFNLLICRCRTHPVHAIDLMVSTLVSISRRHSVSYYFLSYLIGFLVLILLVKVEVSK